MKKISSGKVREIYEVDDNSLLLVVSDRISAFDVILPKAVPDKGKILNQLSNFWFDYTSNLIDNHILSTDIKNFPLDAQNSSFEGRSVLVKKLKMLPIECVVRGYITGSGFNDYKATGTVCGITLTEGLQESQKLPEPIFTPSSKAATGHDEAIDFSKVIDLIGEDLAILLKDTAINIYKKCSKYALSKGIIIADTKFEFGLNEDGKLILADEILTPDSSRFWRAAEYTLGETQDSLDKQYLRNWLINNKWEPDNGVVIPDEVIAKTREKYVDIYEILTGKSFI